MENTNEYYTEEVYSLASDLFDKIEELKKQRDKGYALTYAYYWDYCLQVYRLEYRLQKKSEVE